MNRDRLKCEQSAVVRRAIADSFRASPAARKRLMKENAAMQQQPPPFGFARPDEKDILKWHYVLRGPPDSPYVGGEYHGACIRMLTV